MNDKNDGIIRRWDDTAKEWVLVDRGDTLPYSPSDGDFFQLTKAAAMQTLVDGASQDLSRGTLKVKSTAGFASAGIVHGRRRHRDLHLHEHRRDTTSRGITGCTGTARRQGDRHLDDGLDRQPRPDDRRDAHDAQRRRRHAVRHGRLLHRHGAQRHVPVHRRQHQPAHRRHRLHGHGEGRDEAHHRQRGRRLQVGRRDEEVGHPVGSRPRH